MGILDVAVVGAGPVGLTAALALARRGASVTVFEQADRLSTEWRASTFHPPTIEIARDLGVVSTMLEAGIVARKYQVHDRRDGLIAEFDFGMLADETAYPFRLQLEQYKYTQIIKDAINACPAPVDVRLAMGVTDVSQDEDGAVLSTASGERVAARWVLAADGARSTIRKALGSSFEGLTYEHRYLVLSIDYPVETLLPGICDVNYIADPVEHLLILRVPDVWRIVVSVPPHVTTDEALSDRYVADRLRGVFGDHPELPLRERKIYSVHQRVADTFRKDRVLLLGDAAHVNSPMGGMGLNGGIHDAFDLSIQLSAVLRGEAGADVLDAWAHRRRKAAVEAVQELTHRTTTAMAEQDESERRKFQLQMSEIVADPLRAHDWMMDAAMISNVRAHDLPPRAG
ncbi:FAD-dependent oxidoreductase [Nonomuraea sp. KC401]|uniref:FAD-dependent oxidoreductase n=1 Tax=unclassified Nonomuraea TaxID=2593643 RepID=UPI0010FD1299|nr:MULTISPECIES: FAD-dependent oxidoreductase [unclassified Nonomuraea]NBE91803.1 FAD-dependent oxidoreductase [Nonomuraea sp. K271]TLF86402.1 FAD-dependent oxidoreductase [Nonomuraea sp. KC401]